VPKVYPLEHEEQVLFMDWCALQVVKSPSRFGVLKWIFAIPNGGLRNPKTAAKLKKEGVKRGVPDLFLPCPLGDEYGNLFSGLFIEMKRRRGAPSSVSDDQTAYHEFLTSQGYKVVVAYGADEAADAVRNYLGG